MGNGNGLTVRRVHTVRISCLVSHGARAQVFPRRADYEDVWQQSDPATRCSGPLRSSTDKLRPTTYDVHLF